MTNGTTDIMGLTGATCGTVSFNRLKCWVWWTTAHILINQPALLCEEQNHNAKESLNTNTLHYLDYADSYSHAQTHKINPSPSPDYASAAPVQHSWWEHQWEPARPSVLRRAGGSWENRAVSGTRTAASLWAPRINNPALMQHSVAWPGLANPCQTGLR